MYKRCHKIYEMIWPYFIFIGMSLFILWFQYASRAMILNGDSIFHVNQFYESAMQIKTGHFNWFMTMFGFGQSGRVINAFYGPIFSYFIGGLTLITGTWFRTQMVLEFIVLIISALCMYYLGRTVHFNQILSVSLGVLYSTSFPIVSFIHNQMFDGIGNMLLPLIIILGIKMWHSGKINVLPLSILMAITFQIHVLTTIVAIAALLPFALVSYIISSHKFHWILQLCISIGIFLLLTCNVWVSMLDVFYKNKIIKPFPNMNPHWFSVFWNHGAVTLINQALLGMIALTLFLASMTCRKASWRQRFVFILAIFYMYLSTVYFPWRWVIRKVPIVSQYIQFPDRFLGIAIVLILLTLGNSIELLLNSAWRLKVPLFYLVITIVAVGALGSVKLERQAFNNQVMQWNNRSFFTKNSPTLQHLSMNFNRICKAFNTSRNLELAPDYIAKAMPDYLPSNQVLTTNNYFKIHPYQSTMKELLRYNYVKNRKGRRVYTALVRPRPKPYYFKKRVNNQGLTLTWRQPRSLSRHDTVLPLVKYFHTQVTMDHHRINPPINQIGLIRLSPQAGRHRITINYRAFSGFKFVLLINFISWLIAIINFGYRWKNKIKGLQND